MPTQPAYAVIGKNRTIIWEQGIDGGEEPVVIYDPRSRSFPALSKYGWVAGWLKPGLDDGYCYQIYQRLQHFDLIYLVGGGLWRWSGINTFLAYVEANHEEFPRKVIPLKIFRLTDFPEKKLKKIFRNLTESI